MSSPATSIEESGNAANGNTLLIIPDGSPLWTAPQSDEVKDEPTQPVPSTVITKSGSSLTTYPAASMPKPIQWQIDALKNFTDALVNNAIGRDVPVLICAPNRTSYQLFHEGTKGHRPLVAWHQYAVERNLRITIRFSLVESGRKVIGTTAADATTVDLWFITDEYFYNGGNEIYCTSDDWASVLRRLGFDVRGWSSAWSLIQNVEKKGVTNVIVNDARPSSITIGTFVGLELVTTSYKISS